MGWGRGRVACVEHVIEEGLAICVPVAGGLLGEQRAQRGRVQAVEEPPVALGEELEELLVRERTQACELELEQRVLRRVQVRARARARARARTRLGLGLG